MKISMSTQIHIDGLQKHKDEIIQRLDYAISAVSQLEMYDDMDYLNKDLIKTIIGAQSDLVYFFDRINWIKREIEGSDAT